MSETSSYVTQVRPIAAYPYITKGLMAKAGLSDPEPSPTCVKQGHQWGDSVQGHWPGVTVRFCRRCSRRGAYVALTEELAHA